MKRETLCTIATIIYHCLFLSGASFYVAEFQKVRDTIVEQGDRVEAQAKRVENTGQDISLAIKLTERRLKKVENTCSKLRF